MGHLPRQKQMAQPLCKGLQGDTLDFLMAQNSEIGSNGHLALGVLAHELASPCDQTGSVCDLVSWVCQLSLTSQWMAQTSKFVPKVLQAALATFEVSQVASTSSKL